MPSHIYQSFRSLIGRIETAERRYRDYQALNNMSDYELTDIGLTRGDITDAVRTGRRPVR